MPSSQQYFSSKTNIPSELRTREWDTVSAWLRERAFFMASVDKAETLQAFRQTIAAVTSGKMGAAEARQRMREWLAAAGYRAPVGLEGTVKDLSSTGRLKKSIDTNVAMAHGWAQREENLGDVMHPAQELYRAAAARVPRDWKARWEEAAAAVGWQGVARDGSLIALTTSPIWVALSRFGQPYPPFDFGSHMRVRLVGLGKCMQIGLVSDPRAMRGEMEAARRSLNEGVQVDARGWGKDIREELESALQGLAEFRDGALRMTDPNGTAPYPPEKLAEVITAPLPGGIPHLQLQALRDWMEDSKRFNGERPQVGLNEKEDMARLIRRCMSKLSTQTLERGISFSTQEKLQDFITDIRENGSYRALPGKVADSWSMSDRTAERYAGDSDWQIKLICTRHKRAKDLRPLYRSVQPQSKTPTMPLSTEAEMLIPGNVRMKITKITEEKTERGKRITVYCEEE